MVYLGAAGQIFTFIPITILSYFLDMTALLFNLISIYLVIERNIAKRPLPEPLHILFTTRRI